ncbi:hypothetical protein LGN20_07230 [Burkholderia cepacia]|uniref:hypothetical protein n=1 Tax=Burkholderia cepacia TaxID=292 RepID=UPI001CF4AFDA|nr:hypothetical protein [Burkholderia cepacia]MCA8213694.1 hypothetical protein [Burkholderia cepacia]
MTIQNENCPLTQNASGQELKTVEARGLSEKDNGTSSENLSQRESPAPGLASEATAQRSDTERTLTEVDATTEVILGSRAAISNGTSSKVGSAPILQKIPVVRDQDGYFIHPDLRHFWTVTMDGAEHCSKDRWAALEAQAGIKTSIYYLESEPEDHPAVQAYWERGEGACQWDPKPEPGWWLIEIGDSEDGPYAAYATHTHGA